MESKRIPLERLTRIDPADFAVFGEIIGQTMQSPLEDFPWVAYWTHHVDIDFAGSSVDFGLLHCRKHDGPVLMESHAGTRETFLPLGDSSVFLLAPPNSDHSGPDLLGLRAFLMDSTLGVALHKGIWHRPPWPISHQGARFALLRTGELVDKTAALNLQIRVVLEDEDLPVSPTTIPL